MNPSSRAHGPESPADTIANTGQWIFFNLGLETYALPTDRIAEMVPAPAFHPYPRKPAYIAGMMTLREKIFPVVDLRLRLGMKSGQAEADELIALIDQRERDHLNWIRELLASVEENRPFTLQTDPHKCASGRWYDAYEGSTATTRMILPRFDAPHKAIHALADRIRNLVATGRQADALAAIQRTKDHELRLLIDLFGEFRAAVRNMNEATVLVLRRSDRLVGILVDAVAEIRKVDPAAVRAKEDFPSFAASGLVAGILSDDNSVRVLLDEDAVFNAA